MYILIFNFIFHLPYEIFKPRVLLKFIAFTHKFFFFRVESHNITNEVI